MIVSNQDSNVPVLKAPLLEDACEAIQVAQAARDLVFALRVVQDELCLGVRQRGLRAHARRHNCCRYCLILYCTLVHTWAIRGREARAGETPEIYIPRAILDYNFVLESGSNVPSRLTIRF